MSLYASKLDQISYRAEFKRAIQEEEQLAGTSRTATGITGSTKQWKVAKKIEAQERMPRQPAAPVNQDYLVPTTTLKFWSVEDLVSISEEQEHDQSERAVIPRNMGSAIGRRKDQLKLQALAKATAEIKTGHANGFDVGAGNANNVVGKTTPHGIIAAGREHLGVKGVSMSTMLILAAPFSWFPFMADDKHFITREFQGGGMRSPTMTGVFAPAYNCRIILVGNRKNDVPGGRDLYSVTAGNVVNSTAYMWEKDCLGYASGLEHRGRISFDQALLSWRLTQWFKAGCDIIDNDGVVKLTAGT